MSYASTAKSFRWSPKKGSLRNAAIALAVTVMVPGAFLTAQDSSGTPAAADNAAQIAALTSTLRSELSRFTADAPVEDIEASIVFILSQNAYDDPIVDAAFDQIVASPNVFANVKQAIENVRRKRRTRGTGALGGGDGSFSGIGFSGPVIGGGGGGSNYTQ
ncbi:hypothetical protein PX699_12855 [Sphingobium sp. H39-3-25]|uniref:hypothetical protein n=1 Tax=Sphingobium arseniciresistens TaxID=3030834 RepID=UPI0023B99561|nr:hypothetical protein [Sphingobium arseniciresistens]